jgi:hypothetical protein
LSFKAIGRRQEKNSVQTEFNFKKSFENQLIGFVPEGPGAHQAKSDSSTIATLRACTMREFSLACRKGAHDLK